MKNSPARRKSIFIIKLWILPCLAVFVLLASPIARCQTADPTASSSVPKTDNTPAQTAPPPAQGDATTTEKPIHVLVVAVANDQLSLDVIPLKPTTTTNTSANPCNGDTNADPCDVMHLTITDNLVKDQLKQLHKGDHIQIVYQTVRTETKKTQELQPSTNTTNSSTTNQSQDKNAEKAKGPDKAKAKDKAGKKEPPKTDNTTTTETKVRLVLKAWCIDFTSPCTSTRVVMILLSAGLCFVLTLIFSGFHPTQLIISEDGRYSNSRFQMALWFFVLIATYIATLGLRVYELGWDFIGGVNIPQNLLLLSGMSALTFAGAKAITENKLSDQGIAARKPNVQAITTGIAQPQGDVIKNRKGIARFIFDLTHNDGAPAVPSQAAVGNQPEVPAQPATPPQFDFGDFQMVIVTLVAVATYVVLVFNFFGTVEYSKIVSLPNLDTTLLATFGLGQGAYLTKKAVGNVGTS